jgi:hypothetical protein
MLFCRLLRTTHEDGYTQPKLSGSVDVMTAPSAEAFSGKE